MIDSFHLNTGDSIKANTKNNTIVVAVCSGDFSVFDVNGDFKAQMQAGETLTLPVDSGEYIISCNSKGRFFIVRYLIY